MLYHGLRREELCRLRVGDMEMDEGVLFFIVQSKGDAIRKIPINPKTLRLIDAYLKKAGHGRRAR
ncbi:MAG: tyrosine-type recombinase/integrase [Thiohalomonadales bacterium]